MRDDEHDAPMLSPVQRAATLLGGHILIGIASVLALGALSLIAGALAFAAGGWPASCLAFGIVLAIASLAVFIRAWMLIRPLQRRPQLPTPVGPTPAACPPAAAPASAPADRPATPPIKAESVMAMAALALGAAAVVGPVRLFRMGVRAYSLWATARSVLDRDKSPPCP